MPLRIDGVALEPAETVEIALKVDGEIYGAWSFPQIRHDAYRIWLLAGVALTLAALVSLMICVRLSRRLKRERDQLLDRITRQSNRSIQ